MKTFLSVVVFSLLVIGLFAGYSSYGIPQIEPAPPPVEEKLDLGAMTMTQYVALGARIYEGKGTCPLCHNPVGGRAPLIDETVALVAERLADARYQGSAGNVENWYTLAGSVSIPRSDSTWCWIQLIRAVTEIPATTSQLIGGKQGYFFYNMKGEEPIFAYCWPEGYRDNDEDAGKFTKAIRQLRKDFYKFVLSNRNRPQPRWRPIVFLSYVDFVNDSNRWLEVKKLLEEKKEVVFLIFLMLSMVRLLQEFLLNLLNIIILVMRFIIMSRINY